MYLIKKKEVNFKNNIFSQIKSENLSHKKVMKTTTSNNPHKNEVLG